MSRGLWSVGGDLGKAGHRLRMGAKRATGK